MHMRIDFFRQLEKKWIASFSSAAYCRLTNFRSQRRGKLHQIERALSEEPEIFLAKNGEEQIYFCRRERHNRYKRGVLTRVDSLAQEYGLDLLKDERNGIFIDCGANVGELGFWAQQRGFRYIAFEPEELEARCIDLNHFDGLATCIRKALWKETATLRFFLKPESADSSAIQFDENAPSIEIEAVDLDSAVDISNAGGPVILKLEAEGAEPEVLEGARETLKKVDYVAVDCGSERGMDNQHTIVETNTFLTQNGFKLIKFQLGRVTALYERV